MKIRIDTLIPMEIRFLLLIFYFASPVFAQQKTLRFINSATKAPVEDADVYTDSLFVGATDTNGNVKVNITGNTRT